MSQTPGDESAAEDPRLVEAVREYMSALEGGQHPNRGEFVARHPDIAFELSACLDGLAFVHSAAGQMNSDSRGEAGPEASIDLSSAQPIGDFRLVREIGRGGMGIVYEAVQLSLGRRVALKVLPFAAALDSRHLERFRNEAQAAARLHHTNIVPVYAVGCERSIHFYAMQLIEGRSLADVIHELRQLTWPADPAPAEAATRTAIPGDKNSTQNPEHAAGALPARDNLPVARKSRSEPDSKSATRVIARQPIAARSSFAAAVGAPAYSAESLSTLRSARGSAYSRSIASLGLQVAEALEYAHRAGVVHRDIKPANLLLDSQGCLWVTDFGLAQFYAESELTRSGDIVGTLRYMSPEQASGRAVVLDQRTDIYSLGVTLYELLTLERAHSGATAEQLLHQLAHEEPRSPRSIDRTIPRELEVILGKCMAKDPADRYPSARALADDLRRFMRDEPIHARPPSTFDKAVKWTRRHKTLARSALAMLCLAAVGLSISTLLIAREQTKTSIAYEHERLKAIEADMQRSRAERASRQARAALDFFSSLAAEEMDKPEFSDVRREMLEESLSYYQSFLEDNGDNPTVSAELDAARARVTAFLAHFSALDAALRASSRVRLLSEDSVRKDLKLTTEQATAALEFSNDFAPRATGSAADLSQMTPEQKGQRFAARTAEIDAAMIRILGSDRAERLRQIQRQVRGPLAFSDSDVVERLALSRPQRSKIRALQSQFRNARFGPGPREDGPGPRHDEGLRPPPEDRYDYEKLRNETTASILASLTDSQVAAWKDLTGAPFTGKVMSGGPGRGRGDKPGEPGHHGGPGGEPGFGKPHDGPFR